MSVQAVPAATPQVAAPQTPPVKETKPVETAASIAQAPQAPVAPAAATTTPEVGKKLDTVA